MGEKDGGGKVSKNDEGKFVLTGRQNVGQEGENIRDKRFG
jgi:hypothetical protein